MVFFNLFTLGRYRWRIFVRYLCHWVVRSAVGEVDTIAVPPREVLSDAMLAILPYIAVRPLVGVEDPDVGLYFLIPPSAIVAEPISLVVGPAVACLFICPLGCGNVLVLLQLLAGLDDGVVREDGIYLTI